jgi:hypothetical protein
MPESSKNLIIFLKKRRRRKIGILGNLIIFNEKIIMDSWNWKKLKDEYPKLTLFKVWVLICKSDEKWGVVSEVFPIL